MVFNSARFLSDPDIEMLENSIVDFMKYLRITWPEQRISPKLHMLEEHMVEFISKWHVGCGFYGEQGGESIHKYINGLRRIYSSVKKDTDRLHCIMKQHLLSCHPAPKAIQPKKRTRNLKRKKDSM